ncbi:unnamed protein product [Protopolystoma xenopodis]|uniref:Uncharacterized protein n=1 Tax=Protopolystoma xenopodis TaxID=117903 RepID=A0A3S5BA71_9PLAT|nr:unnamed protein product [Protopolystoma xenopodis]
MEPVVSSILPFVVDKFELLEVTTSGLLRARGNVIATTRDSKALEPNAKNRTTEAHVTWPMLLIAMLTRVSLMVGVFPDTGPSAQQAEQLLMEIKANIEAQNL